MWPETEIANIATCVVTGNRLFNGYVMNGHPVWQAYEFVNLLSGGEVIVMNEMFRIWKGEQLTFQDVLDYIGGKSTHLDFFEAMEPTNLAYDIGSQKLVLETFYL